MPRPGQKPKRNELGTIGNIMILERELGKLEYRRAKLQERLDSPDVAAAEASALRAERDELESRRPQLIKLLDVENARLAAAK